AVPRGHDVLQIVFVYTVVAAPRFNREENVRAHRGSARVQRTPYSFAQISATLVQNVPWEARRPKGVVGGQKFLLAAARVQNVSLFAGIVRRRQYKHRPLRRLLVFFRTSQNPAR